MNYAEAIDYIHGLYWRGKKSGLDKTKELLDLIGHPERDLRFIHIAGTNGKGSTAVMLSEILQAAGFCTGLYTSPYIVRYNERVRVNHRDIPDGALARLTTYLSKYVEKMEVPPSEFEFGTVLAFLYFKEKKCDYVILETGLGGTFDSTNVIEHPLVCVITALGFDHTALLGSTMEEIADAKAGIIKKNSRVVFYGDNPEGEKVIRARCKKQNCKLRIPDFTKLIARPRALRRNAKQLPKKQIRYKSWENLTLALPGMYQQKNAALVLEAVEALKECGVVISNEAVEKGLGSVRWQARLEVLGTNPMVLVDGSHNPQGMQATLESLKTYFPNRKLTFAFGAMKDKDLTSMVSMFLPMADKVFLTAPNMPRSMKAEELLEFCKQRSETMGMVHMFVCCDTVSELLTTIKKEPQDEVIVIIGSLYLAGEVKNLLAVK